MDHEGLLLWDGVGWHTTAGRPHQKGLTDAYRLRSMLHVLREALPNAEVEIPVNVGPLLMDVDGRDLQVDGRKQFTR